VKVLSEKVPFYQYTQDAEIRSALSRGEIPMRILSSDDSTSGIDDASWELITRCCALQPDDRLTLPDIQKWVANQCPQDNRRPTKPLPGAEILQLCATHYGVDIARAREVLARIIVRYRCLKVQRDTKWLSLRLSFHHKINWEKGAMGICSETF
jgi:hypothetical protein